MREFKLVVGFSRRKTVVDDWTREKERVKRRSVILSEYYTCTVAMRDQGARKGGVLMPTKIVRTPPSIWSLASAAGPSKIANGRLKDDL